jgi:probable rRNA maturation factor
MIISIIQKSDTEIPKNTIKNIKIHLLNSLRILKKRIYQNLNIIFVNPTEIKNINQKYLKRNYPTDVISIKNEIPINNSRSIGEIIICPTIAIKNSKKYHHTFEKEIIELSIHGLIHLYGYDHKNKQDLVKWNNIYNKINNIVK